MLTIAHPFWLLGTGRARVSLLFFLSADRVSLRIIYMSLVINK